MKVKMLVDAPGSPDGVTVNQYEAGETYDVPADLASVFVAENLATAVEAVEQKKAPAVAEDKQAPGPAENKSE